MTSAEEALVHRWHEEGVNLQNADLALELAAADFKFHFAFITQDYPEGAAVLRHWAKSTFEFFPDFHISTKDMISNKDKVAFRTEVTATHGGQIFGVEPTGRELTWDAMGIFRMKDGRFDEFWWQLDLFTLMDQLELVPE